jgi:4-hydroxybenzoyl-CoA thioesterase/acyl-CoA thioester hydrolase
MYEYRTRRRIEFADTDMAGIVHFARFFVFMETAEHELLRAAGSPDVHFEHEGQDLGWPRLAASCLYRSPARLGDVLDIHVRVKRKGVRAMTYAVDFWVGERLVAEGEISSICCDLGESREKSSDLRPVPIPSFLAENLEEAPAD